MAHQLYHWLAWTWGGDGQGGPSGDGYLITSGPVPAGAAIGALLTWLWRSRCEERGCWRTAHREDRFGNRVCRRHYRAGLPAGVQATIQRMKENHDLPSARER